MNTLWDHATPNPAGYRDTRPANLLLRTGDRIVDVREVEEFTGELGHIPGASLVPLATLSSASADWDKDEPVVVVCRSGARSAVASTQLAQAGFSRVMNLLGGMKDYNSAGLAVSHTLGTSP